MIDLDLFFDCSNDVAMATNFGKLILIRYAGISERIQTLQFQFTDIKWQYISYSLYKFNEHWSSNLGDYEHRNSNFWDDTAKFGI